MLHPADPQNAGVPLRGRSTLATFPAEAHVTVTILQYALAALAAACLVASEVMHWGLSGATAALLGGFVGLALKRPSDMLAPKA